MSTVTIIRPLLKIQNNLFTLEEKLPMTMQVAMVGSNGVVIAGDTRWTHFPALRPNQLWATGTYGTNSPKITIDYERGIAVSAAREMETAMRLAQEIAAHLPVGQFENPVSWVEDAGSRVLNEVRSERNTPDEHIEAHCLIVVRRPVHRLFRFQFALVDGQWGSFCQEMTRLAIAGDNVNGAIFWPEAYYNSYPYATRRIPVKNLIPLAAHTVVLAHRLNPVTISGLEVVFCDETGFHRLSKESKESLELTVSRWDQQFGDTILNYSQEFSFEPHP